MTTTSEYNPRLHVGLLEELVTNVSSTDFPGHYPDEDHSWDLSKFKKKLQVKVQKLSARSIEFDLVGVDASIANALRRILIAEVPTIAIEYVYVWNNTSVMVDEVFSHRLGLIPLNVDPALLEMKASPSDQATDRNTIVFKLEIECTRNTAAPRDSKDPAVLYNNSEVLAGHLQWIPQGEQADVFIAHPPAPTVPGTVLVKLRPGQAIEMEMHAVKGLGKDHAKFSPVATASYRLLPHIILDEANPVPPHLATRFRDCFSPGVINVDPTTKKVSVDERGVRGETVSREVLRHPDLAGFVKLARVRDHFIFNVESEGPYEPQRLPLEAIRVMREKISALKAAAEALRAQGEPDGDVQMAET
ncbi:DNA-directed RNA polymerase [Russula earlei]|uniref:DNA-directed RNA polymerase n=1 Tax=Russula earlei TaxID=71964 RepID=A0ACC0U9A6_9AGAM|nr:DNA-directed RNA polymerase [Russula earlei]